MAGPAEIHGLCAGFGNFFHGIGPFIGRNTCCGIHVIYGYGKRSLMVIGIVGHHGAKLQLVHDLAVRRHADEPPGFLCHKINGFPGAELRCHDQVAFVFTVFVICNKDHFTCLYSRYGFFHRIELKFFHLFSSALLKAVESMFP